MSVAILCPNCNKKLSQKKSKYICKRCKKDFKVRNNILLLRGHSQNWSYKYRTDIIPTSEDKTYTRFFKKNINTKFNIGLDFGCGGGKSAMSFAEYIKEYYCIEPSFDGLKMFRKRKKFDKNKFKLINHLGNIPFEDNTFDFVSMISVYEHISNASEYLKEIRRVLKKDGILFIVNETSFYQFLEKIHLIKKKSDPTHVFMKTPNFLEKDLKKHGFKIVKKGYLPFWRWNLNIPRIFSFLSTKGIFICKK